MKLATAALAALFAASGAGPRGGHPAAPTAKGTFKSKEVAFDVASAVAWNGSSLSREEGPGSHRGDQQRARHGGRHFADFLDRKRAFEKLIKDEETAVVYFEFSPQGRYRGLSYYFGSG